MARIALLPLLLLLVSFTIATTALVINPIQCQAVVESWAQRELSTLDAARVSKEVDPLQLRELLFFLHIPRTGGRTYYQCFLKNLYASDTKCDRSYDLLRIDTSAPNCRLLSSHDDYSLITKLPQNFTSVVTNMRHPLDRVLSAYEFSVEVASRYLKLQTPYTARTKRASLRAASGKQLVNTLDIWPWKYLVPLLQADVFKRRDMRQKGTVLSETVVENTYDVPSVVMPLHEFIRHPLAKELVHNGATFQVAGLTNNSALEEAGFIRQCIEQYDNHAKLVLDVAKRRLDQMLYVGLTEKHQESAVMFATVAGGQVSRADATQPKISPSRRVTKILRSRKRGSWVGIKASHDGKLNDSHSSRAVAGSKYKSQGEEAQQGAWDDDMRHAAAVEQKNFVDGVIQKYQVCVANLQSIHRTRRAATLELIKPVNFSKEHRQRLPEETAQEIVSLNALDLELFKHAEKIFEKQQMVVNQPDFLEKRLLHLELEHRRRSQSGEVSSSLELLGVGEELSSEGHHKFLTGGSVITLMCAAAALVVAVVLRSFHRRRSRSRHPPGVHRKSRRDRLCPY